MAITSSMLQSAFSTAFPSGTYSQSGYNQVVSQYSSNGGTGTTSTGTKTTSVTSRQSITKTASDIIKTGVTLGVGSAAGLQGAASALNSISKDNTNSLNAPVALTGSNVGNNAGSGTKEYYNGGGSQATQQQTSGWVNVAEKAVGALPLILIAAIVLGGMSMFKRR